MRHAAGAVVGVLSSLISRNGAEELVSMVNDYLVFDVRCDHGYEFSMT